MQTITITKPDDWHCHFRDETYLTRTVADTAKRFARAIAMPNLTPPLTELADIKAYQSRLTAAIPPGTDFQPLMTLYLTDHTKSETLREGYSSGLLTACKLYPANATTNSAHGVTQIEHCYPMLATMEELGMPLLIHGEVTSADIDVFDREQVFIERHLAPLCQQFPQLKVVLEHITTRCAVEFVCQANPHVAATITAHHLLYDRNHLLRGGIRPHYYCLPILKRSEDQQALLAAATSGNPKFFLGTDSAPHSQATKEAACGCAGIYTAHAAIELYAEIFEQANALDKLENFASRFGADFYGLAYNQTQITLCKQRWQVPEHLTYGEQQLIPLRAGNNIEWKIDAL